MNMSSCSGIALFKRQVNHLWYSCSTGLLLIHPQLHNGGSSMEGRPWNIQEFPVEPQESHTFWKQHFLFLLVLTLPESCDISQHTTILHLRLMILRTGSCIPTICLWIKFCFTKWFMSLKDADSPSPFRNSSTITHHWLFNCQLKRYLSTRYSPCLQCAAH